MKLKQHTYYKRYIKCSSSAKHLKIRAGRQPGDLRMESESAANISQDAKSTLENSFGCGMCGEMFEIEKEFLIHCSGHRFSPPDDLLNDQC